MRGFLAGILTFAAGGTCTIAKAQTLPGPPAAFTGLVQCRTIADDPARLACFDSRSAELDAATVRRDIVVMDRNQVRDTRRTLFGLAVPKLAILDANEADEVKQIEGVVKRARRDEDNRWIMSLQDGASWRQIDGHVLGLEPRVGSKVVVRRAALGSFMMSIERQPGIRVKRVD